MSKTILHHKTLVSTNDELKRLIAEGKAEHGLTVVADSQTGGRGRADRSFWSPPGGLYMSVAVETADNAHLLTVTAAVAVCRALDIDVGIKWVNDIIYKDKKVGGILVEMCGNNRLRRESHDRADGDFNPNGSFAVVGIGLNIHTKEFPPDLPHAGSLPVVVEPRVIRDKLLELCDNFDKSAIIDEYRRKSILLGKTINSPFAATVLDIGRDGELIVRDEYGKIQNITYGEVRICV